MDSTHLNPVIERYGIAMFHMAGPGPGEEVSSRAARGEDLPAIRNRMLGATR
jgi:hypothetical protein